MGIPSLKRRKQKRKIMKCSLCIALFALLCLCATVAHAQGTTKAKIYTNSGEVFRGFIDGYPLQETEEISVFDFQAGKKLRFERKDIARLVIEPEKMSDDSVVFSSVNVYINKNLTVRRFVRSVVVTPHIAVFVGIYAKGLSKEGNTIYYKQNSGLYPQEYYYLIRRGESSASVWFVADFEATNDVSSSVKKRFIKQSVAYFHDAPELCARLEKGEFGPGEWEKVIFAYLQERYPVSDEEDSAIPTT